MDEPNFITLLAQVDARTPFRHGLAQTTVHFEQQLSATSNPRQPEASHTEHEFSGAPTA
jgi:hypothetical protein